MNPETVVALAPSELKEHAPDRDSGAEARAALRRAVEKLRSLQHSDGWWKGELETNVTMDAEDLFLREFLGIRESGATERTAAWIRSRQGADGSWSLFRGGPADLSTTVEAYVALRLAGDSLDAEHMRAAAALVREQGGIERARCSPAFWLALFGAWPWEHLPTLPPELMLLPRWAPLNIYDFACWARQTIVPLSIVFCRTVPNSRLPFALGELHDSRPWSPSTPASMRGRALTCSTARCTPTSAGRYRPLRRSALARAERWIVRRQEADGSWGGIQPPWVYSLIALHLCGYPLEHPVMRAGLGGLDGFDDRRWVAAARGVPVAGLGHGAGRGGACRRRCAGRRPGAGWRGRLAARASRCEVAGDWSVRRPGSSPAAGRSSSPTTNYPDVDDTAEVVLALLRVAASRARARGRAIERAVRWVEGMQDRNGGWAAFDAGNTSALVRELPFCDFGEVIDPPSADVSAHALEMLAADRPWPTRERGRGRSWLVAEQEPGGSWFGRWGVNHVYGTGAVLPAADRDGMRAGDPTIRRAVRWLEDAPERRRRLGRGRAVLPRPRPGLVAASAPPRRLRGRCWRCTRPASVRTRSSSGLRWLRPHAAPGRRVGRAGVHGDGLSVRLLDQLPPLPARVPDHGAGTPEPMTAAAASPRAAAPTRAAVMARAREENFPVAIRLVGARRRSQLLAIYGFARLVDDAGDEAVRRPLGAAGLDRRRPGAHLRGRDPRASGDARAGADRSRAGAPSSAVPAPDRGRSPRPGRPSLPQLRGAARLLPAVGGAGRRARPARLRSGHSGPHPAVRLDLRGPTTDRAPPGRRRGPRARSGVPAG